MWLRGFIQQSSSHAIDWGQAGRILHRGVVESGNLVENRAHHFRRIHVNADRRRCGTQDLDLYGVGWDGPSINVSSSILPATLRGILHEARRRWQRFRPDPLLVAAKRVWRGPAKSKSETLGEYKFALCFENSILKGWVTEKIFDCLFTGTIPVYLGAPEITSHVPADCFIDMRRFSGYDELRKYLRSLDEQEISKFKRNARDFLQSDQFRPFSKSAFVDLFRRIVAEDAA